MERKKASDFDQELLNLFDQSGAKTRDMDSKNPFLDVRLRPHLVEQLALGHQLSSLADEHRKEIESLRGSVMIRPVLRKPPLGHLVHEGSILVGFVGSHGIRRILTIPSRLRQCHRHNLDAGRLR